MMNRSLLSIIFAACALALVAYGVSNAVYSRQFSSGSQARPGLAPISTYLNLTPEQQEQIASIEEKFQAEQQTACADMQEARKKLLETLKSDAPKSEVDAALEDVESAQSRLQRQSAEYLLDIKPLLTQEQRDKLFDLVGQRFCNQGRCGSTICPAGSGPACNGNRGCSR